MSTTKIASEVFKIVSPITDVYDFLSNFNNVGRLLDMARQTNMTQELAEINAKIEKTSFTEDSCCITLEGGRDIELYITEREASKLIKLEGGVSPTLFNFWIQLLENGPYDTRMKITFQGELNFMLKMLVKGKLEKGINALGSLLSKLPYSLFKHSN